jgi:hypothetical protein
MDTREFLELLTPDGLRCITMQVEGGLVQMPAKTLDDAVALVSWVDKQKKNCHFALASFVEEHLNEKGKRRVARKRKNVDKLKALWLDIDFKSLTKPIGETLTEFYDATEFPKATVMVHSGNGVHLYWPLAEAIGFDEWSQLARAFKTLCQRHGLPADHACTADSARVLRPVGTSNWKDPRNPKPVRFLGGSGGTFRPADLLQLLCGGDNEAADELPEHLRAAAANASGKEFTQRGAGRDQDARQVFRKCGVMQHVLATKGAGQSEPEWNATLMLLAHLSDGAKFVHAMSEGHPGYSADVTMQKWQQKVEAVEEGSGPTLCATFEGYHPDICKACPFYQSKKIKTPKSLAYTEDAVVAAPARSTGPRLMPVLKETPGFPKGWRVDGDGYGIERRTWDPDEKQEVWMPALRQVWTLQKAMRNIRERDYYLTLTNEHRGNIIEVPLPGETLGNARLAETLARYGAPITEASELKSFKALMTTWLDQIRADNLVEDTTDQLGWIEQIEGEDVEVLGFATGSTAYYRDGTERTGVVAANSKHKGIVKSFEPCGSVDRWKECADFITKQGCSHLVTMLASGFAGPLMRFTSLNGGVLSIVSADSGAGKTCGMSVAQAVWGDPSSGPATIQDTPTVVKNKIAYLQNLTAYWDEVRGNDDVMNNFVQIAFQVTQGRDRERANSSAETITAQTWKTLLVTASNDSLFDVAATRLGSSDAGVYRIFELAVGKSEFPSFDPAFQSGVVELQHHFGRAGMVYAKWLADNYDRLQSEIEAMQLNIAKAIKQEAAERFWVATITTLIMGAKYANEAGLTNIDVRKLTSYLINGVFALRARTTDSREVVSPRELIAAFMQKHQGGGVTLSRLSIGPGKHHPPEFIGDHQHVRSVAYVIGADQGLVMVSKQMFTDWLHDERGLRWNSAKVQEDFRCELQWQSLKARLAGGTRFALPRQNCLLFTIDMADIEFTEDSDDAK